MDVKKSLRKRKTASRYILLHLLAMFLVAISLLVTLLYGLSAYTRHGEGIEIPNLYGQPVDDAKELLAKQGIIVAVNDTGYNKRVAAGCILTQSPGANSKVKQGRTIFVTINSTSSPMIRIPDIIDNSSYREAQARLTAIGFQVLEPQFVDGERDWVYGVKANGKSLQSGDMIPAETALTLIIGRGSREEDNEDAMLDTPEDDSNMEQDEFEEIVE